MLVNRFLQAACKALSMGLRCHKVCEHGEGNSSRIIPVGWQPLRAEFTVPLGCQVLQSLAMMLWRDLCRLWRAQKRLRAHPVLSKVVAIIYPCFPWIKLPGIFRERVLQTTPDPRALMQKDRMA